MAVLSRDAVTSSASVARRRSLGSRLRGMGWKLLLYAVLIAGVMIFIAPFAWMITASVQSLEDMFSWPPSWIPVNPTFANYAQFFQQENVARWFLNSAFVAISVTALQLFFNSLAAYTFEKRRFPGREPLFLLMLGTMMIPGQVTLIPAYLILKHVPLFGGNNLLGQGGHGWLDSYWGLIAPASVSAFGIFLLRQYMKSVPNELLDAARIDGAGSFRIYWQVVLPLCMPALAAMGIFTFTYEWDDFFWPLIIISSDNLFTVQLGLATFIVKNRTIWNLVMAGSVVATLPVLIAFLLFQRHLIKGIALTGLR